jgi:hypothetical protein
MPPSLNLAAEFRRGRASQPDPAFPQSPGLIPGSAPSCLSKKRVKLESGYRKIFLSSLFIFRLLDLSHI